MPIPNRIATTESDLRRSLRYLPLVGVAIGFVAMLVWGVADLLLPSTGAVLIMVAATALLTGALHEDGLADTAEGIGGGSTRERALEIMRDSRIGTYGVLALVIVIGTKAATLSALPDLGLGMLIIAANCVSRASITVAMWRTKSARNDGLGAMFGGGPGLGSVAVALATAAVLLAYLAAVLGVMVASAAFVGAVLGHIATRAFYQPKLGGYTGDTLGAVQQVTELAMYVGAAAVMLDAVV